MDSWLSQSESVFRYKRVQFTIRYFNRILIDLQNEVCSVALLSSRLTVTWLPGVLYVHRVFIQYNSHSLTWVSFMLSISF